MSSTWIGDEARRATEDVARSALPEAPVRGGDRGHRGAHRPRRVVAVVIVAVAFLAGVAATAVLGATGAFDAWSSATTGNGDASGPGLDAKAIYAAASPGVVQITATGGGGTQPDPFGGGSVKSVSTGAGFVTDRSGHIVTAAHVIDGARSVKVTFSDGTTRAARLLGRDNSTDTAVVEVKPSSLALHTLPTGSSAGLDVGDGLAVVGSPFGFTESISTGIVSGLDRTVQSPNGSSIAHAIQTDAAMNPGNSGGPILDSSGHVVGIADQIATGGSTEQSSGVGFAVPVDLIARELPTLEAGGTVQHAYLGVSTAQAVTIDGAMVAGVIGGSPASRAGLRAGDVITSLDGTRVTGSGDLVAAIAAHDPGQRVLLTVRRGAATASLTPTLGTQQTR